MTCLFCQPGGEPDVAYARRDGHPVTPGHTLVIPGRHIVTMFDATPREVATCWQIVEEVRRLLIADDPSITGFNVGFNAGPSAGQTVPHAHVHVIPRRDGDVPNPRGGVRGCVPDRMSYEDGAA